MWKQNFFELFLLSGLLNLEKLSNCEINVIPCKYYDVGNSCLIENVTLHTRNYKFVPDPSHPSNSEYFVIDLSTVTVLTSDICTTFPEIIVFVARWQGIQIIENYAFTNCTRITDMDLNGNNIHTIGKEIFPTPSKLTLLYMDGSRINVDLLSKLHEMMILSIGENGLKELPLEAIKNMKYLRQLSVESNELFDLDAEGFIQNFPDLERISINDNNFPCNRLTEIVDAFNVKIFDFYVTRYRRKRDYVAHGRVGPVMCLTQEQVHYEKNKRASLLEESKNNEIGESEFFL